MGSATNPKKTKGKASGNNMIGDGEATNQTNSMKEKKQVKTTKFKNLVKSKNHDFLFNCRNRETGTGFFILKARLTFTLLRQAFVEAPILCHFDPKCHI